MTSEQIIIIAFLIWGSVFTPLFIKYEIWDKDLTERYKQDKKELEK